MSLSRPFAVDLVLLDKVSWAGTDLVSLSLSAQEGAGDAGTTPGSAASTPLSEDFRGTLSQGDADWVAVELTAGTSYVFTAQGRGGSANGLADPVLRLVGPNGAVLATGDDAADDNPNAMIEFTAATSGTYHVEVSGYGGSAGAYTLRAADVDFDTSDIVNQIVYFNWGMSTKLRLADGGDDELTVDLTTLTADGRQLARWALEAWSEVTGFDFQEVTSTSANIYFTDDYSGATGGPYSNFLGGVLDPGTGVYGNATVSISASWTQDYGNTLDSFSFGTYLHEIGHALGLAHTGPYDGSGTYGSDNIFINDTVQATVMSYFEIDDLPGQDYAATVTPMYADIAGIEEIYGAPAGGIRPGDTVYGSNSNVGGYLGTLFDAVVDGASSPFYDGGPVALTIADTGGRDTIDLSPLAGDAILDLRPGGIGGFDGLVGNLVIAGGTIVEVALTGAGDDRIIGNDADNVLDAGAGADILDGGAGDDTLDGGAGDDTLGGGGGTDTMILQTLAAAVTVTVDGDALLLTWNGQTDRVTSIESFVFDDATLTLAEISDGAIPDPGPGPGPEPEPNPETLPEGPYDFEGAEKKDVFQGSGEGDLARGGENDDFLDGGAGNDRLFGEAGNDDILGRDGNDSLFGGAGDDDIAAAAGSDTIYGGDGVDRIGGGTGDDRIWGGTGTDEIGGGTGDDEIHGGDGNEQISAGLGEDVLHGDDGDDTIGAGADRDMIWGGAGNDDIGGGFKEDEIYGGDGDDIIGTGTGSDTAYGGLGDDFLAGSIGSDRLYGGAGADRINGGEGEDVMSGGRGADMFIFTDPGSPAQDRILDFNAAQGDVLRFTGVAGASKAEQIAQLKIEGAAGSTLISYGQGTILLDGVQADDLSGAQFLFV